MLPVSQFNAQIVDQKKGFETELVKLTLQIDAEKCKNTSMEENLKMSLAPCLISAFYCYLILLVIGTNNIALLVGQCCCEKEKPM